MSAFLKKASNGLHGRRKFNDLVLKFSGAGTLDEILRIALQEIGTLPVVSEVNVHLNPDIDKESETIYEVNGNQEQPL